MTTMRALLTRAIRKTRTLQIGETVESVAMEAALEDAQGLIRGLTNWALTDVVISANYTAGEDERITDTSGSATVTRPTTVTDNSTQETRPPRNGAVIEVTGTTPTRHVYVSELKTWSAAYGLTLDSEQPFGPAMDDALSDMLAARFCENIFQIDPTAVLIALASQGRADFGARFAPPITVQIDPGLRIRVGLSGIV